jgi:hypothetical protein
MYRPFEKRRMQCLGYDNTYRHESPGTPLYRGMNEWPAYLINLAISHVAVFDETVNDLGVGIGLRDQSSSILVHV